MKNLLLSTLLTTLLAHSTSASALCTYIVFKGHLVEWCGGHGTECLKLLSTGEKHCYNEDFTAEVPAPNP